VYERESEEEEEIKNGFCNINISSMSFPPRLYSIDYVQIVYNTIINGVKNFHYQVAQPFLALCMKMFSAFIHKFAL